MPRTESGELFSISKNGDSTVSLADLCQYSVILTWKSIFWCSKGTFCISVCAHLPLLDWTQCSRYVLTSGEQKARINFLSQLGRLCLMGPRIPLALLSKGTLLAPFQLSRSTRLPRSFSSKLLSCGVPRVQDFALLVELEDVPVSLFFQPVKVPSDDSITFCSISHSSQLAEGILCSIIYQ